MSRYIRKFSGLPAAEFDQEKCIRILWDSLEFSEMIDNKIITEDKTEAYSSHSRKYLFTKKASKTITQQVA